MTVTFLHLSDLHFQPQLWESCNLVKDAFFGDVQEQLSNAKNPFLLFSGDFIKEGGSDEQIKLFLEQFDPFLTACGLPCKRRICVPGNHDVSRSALKTRLLIHTATLDAISDERHFNDEFPQLSQLILRDKFEPYIKFESSFASFGCCQESIGGNGWEISPDVGVYCLNTALCSSAGLPNREGHVPSDSGKLHVYTRDIHSWLSKTKFKQRILVLHHPTSWLSPWARQEVEAIAATSFNLVFSGHLHDGNVLQQSNGLRKVITCAAPPLFTNKTERLGYSLVTLEDSGKVSINYREWSPRRRFVAGTGISGNDLGIVVFTPDQASPIAPAAEVAPVGDPSIVQEMLQHELDEATTCYASKKRIWVGRDLSKVAETSKDRKETPLISSDQFLSQLKTCVIRSPKQYGLTALAKYWSMKSFEASNRKTFLLTVDAGNDDFPNYEKAVKREIEKRCRSLGASPSQISGIIIDSPISEYEARKIFAATQKAFPSLPVVLLFPVEYSPDISGVLNWDELAGIETLYLYALSRSRVRELVAAYIADSDNLDEDAVTKKVLDDIDALNMHRTPLNCILLLKLLEQAFDDSPVNRTEVIGRVLFLMFHQFNKIPRYATRPDLKDCEYALGYFCEWLIREKKLAFTKREFDSKVEEYTRSRAIDMDREVLFSFLQSERILVLRAMHFEFRFNFWVFYFAAHRMHHHQDFASFILHNGRYTSMPEIIEFYAGIDRRRKDAVERLTLDLRKMNEDFIARTGIARDFDLYKKAEWAPSSETISKLYESVQDNVQQSGMPKALKDAIADRTYDPSRPYRQEIAKFIRDSSLKQMIHAMQGAARALRNSDHVSPASKSELLKEVMACWKKVCQVLILLSPALAEKFSASFEDMGYYLGDGFENAKTVEERWKLVMTVIPDNVVSWYKDEVFSRKMGPLFSKFITDSKDPLEQLMLVLLLILQRPPGWQDEVESYILRTYKNSFYLSRVSDVLHQELLESIVSEPTRMQLRRLTAMVLAKHHIGAAHPSSKTIARVAKQLDKKMEKDERESDNEKKL